jgi:hypothetical protein
MNHSTDISKIALALVKAQAAMPAVGKEGNNPAFRSKYMTLDGILSVAVPVLTANGMALVQGSEVVAKDDNDRPVSITVESRLIHESGEWIASSATIPVSKPDAHGMGSAITYGRRYSVASLLGIMAGEDDDANGAANVAPQPQTRQTTQPSRPVKLRGFHISEPIGGNNGNG